ncbi:maleylpyruvate isomerase family mycothiol-dependent enzyme [Allorhizocola rhizosphaerae]|uniref:maleylpyruvate isomerase family mycothiol-dependent enzyme n=1 Tax=Allorhizocola rhizosphaerae TaxID=1872709 RepID=UPI000E3E1004|nr:maleylpyruvate isomerase family mycothiol-dependent enzyme [Allorhizocola rhizosphaerae]
MTALGSKEFWLESLRGDANAFRAIAAEADLDAPVPTCPGWTVRDLVHHLGGVYRWVLAFAGRGTTEAPDPELRRRSLNEDFPPEGETLAWWDEQASSLVKLLESVDPQLPAWNWAPQAKVASFWHRRMANETAVHRWDMQMSQGLAEPIDTRLAADGVREVLDSYLPAQRLRKGPTDRFGVVALLSTDTEHEWFIRLRGEGIALLDTATILDHTDPNEQVTAAGTASDLDLALWGRIGFDMLDVSGDESLLYALRIG